MENQKSSPVFRGGFRWGKTLSFQAKKVKNKRYYYLDEISPDVEMTENGMLLKLKTNQRNKPALFRVKKKNKTMKINLTTAGYATYKPPVPGSNKALCKPPDLFATTHLSPGKKRFVPQNQPFLLSDNK